MSDDEFGDSSFLMAVDLDTIEASASTEKPSKRVLVATGHASSSSQEKRRKVSLSPSNRDVKLSPESLESTLSKYFGHAKFRGGQLSVIQAAIVERKDSAVFWATGRGKSMCFQIPSLHTKKITLVVSPLISLMKDQVYKLNGLRLGKDLATFLGSGQTDPSMERAALQGEYLLVYVTPEKLLSAGFLDQLTALHTTKKEIGLIAIDEAHCVSEWGHDFRPEFRRIGQVLRGQASPCIQHIPIMVLTATAVPKVQQDICKTLKLNRPYVERQSFDRTNLVISVHKKDGSSGVSSAMEPLLKVLKEAPSPQQQSTIVYCPTRSQVEEIGRYLKQRLEEATNKIQVEMYHAGMTMEARNQTHTNFLTGKTTVLVGTAAFGMGIDKSDTRRVIHYGPPKTVEEYYQQIGRAGRDGIKAECTMWVSESDFDKYLSDFYLGGLEGSTQEAVVASIAAMKSFALDASTCRRKKLLDFFNEKPSFGERCGTCDSCQKHATYDENDLERDFGSVARVVLQAAEALDDQGAGAIVDVVSGKSVDSYRYRRGKVESKVKDSVQARKMDVRNKISQQAYREFLVPLVQRGFMKEATRKTQVNGYTRSWTTYAVTPKGYKALYDCAVAIVLPVPELFLQMERKEQSRRERVLSQLKESGVQIENLPQEEIEVGDGEVIRALSKWQGYIESMRRNGKVERVAQLEELHKALEVWRSKTAVTQRVAPASVLAEPTLFTLSYAAATLPSGLSMGESDLVAAGVRTRGISSLCEVLAGWSTKYQSAKKEGGTSGAAAGASTMKLSPGEVVKASRPWKHAVYKAAKKTGLASWESSYKRFVEGESPQTISLTPANGRPIQVSTVCNHILQGIVQGRGADLHRLANFLSAPTSSEWEQLQAAEISQSIDVVEDAKAKKSDLLRPILGDKLIDLEYTERNEEERDKYSLWCRLVDWYMALRRIDYKPTFL